MGISMNLGVMHLDIVDIARLTHCEPIVFQMALVSSRNSEKITCLESKMPDRKTPVNFPLKLNMF